MEGGDPGGARDHPCPLLVAGDRDEQTLVRVDKTPGGIKTTPLSDVRFVPLLGEFGWREGTA